MTISKGGVDEFLARERKSWTWVKRWSRADIIEELKSRGAPMRFKTRPRKHQLACYLLGLLNPRFLFLLDMGLGKTLLTLMLFMAARHTNPTARALVCVPKKVHMGTWAEEIEKHTSYTCDTIDAVSIERKWEQLMTSEADIVIVDYQGLGLVLTRKAKVAGKVKRVRDDSLTRRLREKFLFLGLDEMHRTKNRDTTRFGIMRQLVKAMQFVYGLTGTVQGRDPQDLWGQFFLLDGGYTLGETLGLFRAAFMIEKPNWFGGKDYKFDKAKQAELSAFIQHLSIAYDEKECLDLPPMVPIKRKYRLTAAQREVYDELRAGKMVDLGDGKLVRVPHDGVFIRMREVTSGYVRRRVNGVPVTVMFDENPKLEMFENDITNMPADRKAIVFYDYNPTGDMLADLLHKHKIKHLTLNGATKDAKAIERKFREDDSVRVLLCNAASGSEGINAQAANYQFYYESPVSPITRKQSMKRAHRQGQERRVFVTDYVAAGTVDESILEYIEQGLNMLQALKHGSKAAQRSLFSKPK